MAPTEKAQAENPKAGPSAFVIERAPEALCARSVLAAKLLARCEEQRRCDAGHDRAEQEAAKALDETDHGIQL